MRFQGQQAEDTSQSFTWLGMEWSARLVMASSSQDNCQWVTNKVQWTQFAKNTSCLLWKSFNGFLNRAAASSADRRKLWVQSDWQLPIPPRLPSCMHPALSQGLRDIGFDRPRMGVPELFRAPGSGVIGPATCSLYINAKELMVHLLCLHQVPSLCNTLVCFQMDKVAVHCLTHQGSSRSAVFLSVLEDVSGWLRLVLSS